MTCSFVLIRIHLYENILVQCMHNHFFIEATGSCVWALAGCGPLELSSPFPLIWRCCYHLIDISCYNAYVLFTCVDPSFNSSKCFRRRLFLEQVGKEEPFSQRAFCSQPGLTSPGPGPWSGGGPRGRALQKAEAVCLVNTAQKGVEQVCQMWSTCLWNARHSYLWCMPWVVNITHPYKPFENYFHLK